MPSLRELQTGFSSALRSPETETDVPLVADPRRINVYRNNFRITLRDTLGSLYPVVRKLVGDAFFHQCASDFVRRNPSRSGDLNDYGETFADFLSDYEAAQSLPYLDDVARLEWAYQRAFHAADAQSFDAARLAAISPEQYAQLVFKLHPSAGLVTSRYPTLRIWKSNQDDAAGEDSIKLDDGGDALLVVRPELDIEFIRLSEGAFRFLDTLMQGHTFDVACNNALETESHFELNEFFGFCITHGIIVDFELQESLS